MTKPSDWEKTYHIEITGKTLEAMEFLVNWLLKPENRRVDGVELLLPLSIIGACDHLYHIQSRIRAGKNSPEY